MAEAEKKISAEDAQAILRIEEGERVQKCRQRINEILAEGDCRLQVLIVFDGTASFPQINVVVNRKS